MWEKREQDWENERLARKKLLEEVISVQKIQARRLSFIPFITVAKVIFPFRSIISCRWP